MNYHSKIKVYKNHLGQQPRQRKKESANKWMQHPPKTLPS